MSHTTKFESNFRAFHDGVLDKNSPVEIVQTDDRGVAIGSMTIPYEICLKLVVDQVRDRLLTRVEAMKDSEILGLLEETLKTFK